MKRNKRIARLFSLFLVLFLIIGTCYTEIPEVKAYADVEDLTVMVGYWGMDGYDKQTVSLSSLASSCGTHKEVYTWIDKKPSAGTTEAEGIYIADLLDYFDIDQSEVYCYNFFTLDADGYAGATEQWTQDSLFGTRYTYKDCFKRVVEEYRDAESAEDYVTNPEKYYRLSDFFSEKNEKFKDSASNERTTVEPMLALSTYAVRWEGDLPMSYLDYKETTTNGNPQLLFGQTSASDAGRYNMAKMVYKIHVWFEGSPSISIAADSLEGEVGSTHKLDVSVSTPDEYLTQMVKENLEWSSSDESIAKVDEYGNVTIVGEGEASISVSYGGEGGTSIGVSSGTGEGTGEGTGDGTGSGDGTGNGTGEGTGTGTGSGNGEGTGSGDGTGDGTGGSGTESGDGTGTGDGNVEGDGTGTTGEGAGDNTTGNNTDNTDKADTSKDSDKNNQGNGSDSNANAGQENGSDSTVSTQETEKTTESTSDSEKTEEDKTVIKENDDKLTIKSEIEKQNKDKVVVSKKTDSAKSSGSSKAGSDSSGEGASGGVQIYEYAGTLHPDIVEEIKENESMRWIFVIIGICVFLGFGYEAVGFRKQVTSDVTEEDFKKLAEKNKATKQAPEFFIQVPKWVKIAVAVLVIAIIGVGGRLLYGPPVLFANISAYEDEQILVTGLGEDFYVTAGELADLELEWVSTANKVGTSVTGIGPSLETFLEAYGNGITQENLKQIRFVGSDDYATTFVKTAREEHIVLCIASGWDPLDEYQWPLRIIVPGDSSKSVRMVTTIEFTVQ